MFTFVQFLVIATAITAIHGVIYQSFSSLENYYHSSQRDLLWNIEIMNKKIDLLDTRAIERINVIAEQQKELLNKTIAVNSTNFPLQALSQAYKYCIQEYDPLYISNEIVSPKLGNCYATAMSKTKGYTLEAKTQNEKAEYAASYTLDQEVERCKAKYGDRYSANLEECYVQLVDDISTSVKKDLSDVDASLEKNLISSTNDYKLAVDCSYEVEQEVLKKIAEVNEKIEDCLKCYTPNNYSEC